MTFGTKGEKKKFHLSSLSFGCFGALTIYLSRGSRGGEGGGQLQLHQYQTTVLSSWGRRRKIDIRNAIWGRSRCFPFFSVFSPLGPAKSQKRGSSCFIFVFYGKTMQKIERTKGQTRTPAYTYQYENRQLEITFCKKNKIDLERGQVCW